MGKRNRPEPPSKVHVDDGRGLAAIADEAEANGRDVAPAYAGVDDELVEGKPLLDGLGDFDGGEDHLEPLDESELELEAPADEEEAEAVQRIHKTAPPDPPAPVRVRWIVPPTSGPAHSHAMLTDGKRTLCFGHRVEGALYPPAADLPRCTACVDALAGLRKAAADAS